MKFGVACGGTGGHIFPGLMVAKTLRKRGHDVTLWLSGRDVERGSTVDWDGEILSVKASGFPTGLSLKSIQSAGSLVSAVGKCRKLMKDKRPDAVIAMGSYSSVGPVVSAWSLGVPTVLHEANAVPGRAISLLSRFASVVAVSFQETTKFFHRSSVVVTGFPIRDDLSGRFEEAAGKRFTLLIMGGSQGSHMLNSIGSATVIALKKKGLDLRVIHLTGATDADSVRKAYEEAGVEHRVFSFLKEIGMAYNSAQLAIARSGAASCAELQACGVPALLVPFPAARRDHQLANAMALRRAGGVDVIEEKDLKPEWLENYIEDYIRRPSKMERMKEALQKNAGSGAAERIADLLESEVTRGTARGKAVQT